MLPISDRSVELIKRYEGYRKRPYWNGSRPNIGFDTDTYPDGQTVSMGDEPITLDLALVMLRDKLNREILPYMSKWIKVSLTQNQVDALASLIHEITLSKFKHSDVLKAINRQDLHDIQNAWMSYNMRGHRTLNGMIARRREELALFNKPNTN